MGTFTVNGKLAAIAKIAAKFAEFRLQTHGADYHQEPALLVMSASGELRPMPLYVDGDELDEAREMAFEMIFAAGHERAVFFSEAWRWRYTADPGVVNTLVNDPERREVVVLDGRDRAGNRVIACHEILRTAEPSLGAVEYSDPGITQYAPSTTGV
jgi:hypothetical protein